MAPCREPSPPNPGWWPCYDYKDLMEMISRVIRKRKPDCDIVFWSYNWNRVDAKYRKALIDTLPKDITLQATFEMGTIVERDGFLNRTADYTLFFPGPGPYFNTEGQFAKENGLRFYSMTNTGGLTWDIGVIPYEPAPYQWIKRYEGMIDAHERLGLCGTMDSHHFGFNPSFISDLAKWAFHYPRVDLDKKLHEIMARDFSEDAADKVCDALKLWSEGIHHMISTNQDQYGPCRMGPAYPFILYENRDLKIPTVGYAHFGGNTICHAEYGTNGGRIRPGMIDTEENKRRFDYETEGFRIAKEKFDQGAAIIEAEISRIPQRKREGAMRILGVGKFIARTAETAYNVREFLKLKLILPETAGEERNKTVDLMLDICKKEAENARSTIPLVEFDSRLGYEPSMEYMCDREHIEWKLKLLSEVMEKELPSYYTK